MIRRFKENPLIYPDSQVAWMTENAFNPGVIKDNEGVFHMLIRGNSKKGTQEKSDLGYASSEDGINWKISPTACLRRIHYLPMTEQGIEDARIVHWNGYYYIFATACHKGFGRIGIWRTRNFTDFGWVGIPFDWEDKDASIIPELINNKVFLIHRMAPNMWISETSDISLRIGWANTRMLLKATEVRLDGSVPHKIGLAAQPMKFGKDWFIMFHAIFEPFEYSISFMILDGADLHIKYLHDGRILQPELPCEKYGAVPNVCFLTGIVDMGDRWYVYWGGADTVICGGELLKEDITIKLGQ